MFESKVFKIHDYTIKTKLLIKSFVRIKTNTVEATYEGRLYKGTAAYKGTL